MTDESPQTGCFRDKSFRVFIGQLLVKQHFQTHPLPFPHRWISYKYENVIQENTLGVVLKR